MTNVVVRSQVPSQQRPRGITEAQDRGLRYQGKVHEYLSELLGRHYLEEPQLKFLENERERRLYPDGVYLAGTQRAFVFEIKIEHMPEAWWQLDQLYCPVIARLGWRPRCYAIEVCRSFDPAMPFPCDTFLISDLRKYLADPSEGIGVLIWRPE